MYRYGYSCTASIRDSPISVTTLDSIKSTPIHVMYFELLPIFHMFKLSSVQLLALRYGARKFHVVFECECSYVTLRLRYVTLSP